MARFPEAFAVEVVVVLVLVVGMAWRYQIVDKGRICVSEVAVVSPSATLSMWRYWFRLSRDVYDGNRSFAPILRQSQWSLLYDVY